MGNTQASCFSWSNTSPRPADGSQNTVPSHTPQPTNTPPLQADGSQTILLSQSQQPGDIPTPPADGSQSIRLSQSQQPGEIPESSSDPMIESIQRSIEGENTNEYIDQLINMLNDVLSNIKGQRQTGTDLWTSKTKSASEVVNILSKEAEKISNRELIYEGLGSAASTVLNAIGSDHSVLLGLSLVAYTIEMSLKKKGNDSACVELLEELLALAKDLKDFEKAVPGEIEKVHKAIHEILVEAVKCRLYMDKMPGLVRYFTAGAMESHLQKTNEIIQRLRTSLIQTTVTHIARGVSTIRRHTPAHSLPSPLETLGFQPEGIEGQVADVIKKLDIGGSEQTRAVVIVGIGGIGKSTLAASVIENLKLSDFNFKYSMVTIDQKSPDRNSHILKLQSDIIFHFTEHVHYLKDSKEGREKLQAAMANKCCFLHIDNVVDSYYIKELLPTELVPQRSEDVSKSAENSVKQMQQTKIRMLITSRQKDLKPLLKFNIVQHEMAELSGDAAKKLLSTAIFQGDKPAEDFDEESMINELAAACGGLPLLLSVFGNHLKENRDKGIYEEAIKALKVGNIDSYESGREELLSETLMFVYDRMKDEEAQEAFLDICTFFYGYQWDLVAQIMDTTTLATLHDKRLIIKSEAGKVIVHDILRLMGVKKAKNTRLTNHEEFFNINDDDSKLKSVKGMVLLERTFLAKLETRHLSAMRHSLRFLVLGDWVEVDGPPCERAFKNLRYLQVGDLKYFPFKDVSKMEKLNVFENSSKPGMALIKLPQSLKHLTHDIRHPDCNEFASLPLKNLKSLKQFTVQTERSVKLPQGFKLPVSLEHLRLNRCEQLPETLGHLSVLQTVSLDYCDFKCLPQGLTQYVQLRSLSLQHCTNMTSLPDNTFGTLCLLRDLDLSGCTRLEELPGDLGTLTALQNLNINKCVNLRLLPENFGGLKSLKTLDFNGCTSLQRLPDSFGMLCIERLTLQSLDSIKELPQNIGDLSCLQSITIMYCGSLESVPESFVRLRKLDYLNVVNCKKLGALPNNFDQLCNIKKIILSKCPRLTRLPDGFEGLTSLNYMELFDCSSLVDLPASFEMLSCLERLHLSQLPFSRLPDGLGKLKRLKILSLMACSEFQTSPQDFENLAALEILRLWDCRMLEGTTMDKIVKLQNCHFVGIGRSTKLIERWNALKEENMNLPMFVKTSWDQDEHEKELDRTRRVGLLCGKCIQLDSTGKEFIHHSSLSIPNHTTIAVVSLHNDQLQLLQPIVDMAKKRATTNCAGQLTIIYVCRRSDGSDAPNHEHETENILQALTKLPQPISYAIPSTDIRRLSLIGRVVFRNANVFNDGKFLCFMVDVKEDDEGHPILKDGKCVTEDEISKKSGEKLPISEISDGEVAISDGMVDFIDCICESKTERPSGRCSRLPEENVAGKLIQNLKKNNIHHFSDNKVKVDHLQGKTLAIILIDPNYPGWARLQQIYLDIKAKHPNFEAIWIPLPLKQDFGFGSYSRAIEGMPWLTLADPKLINVDHIKDKSPRVIIINSGGSIVNPNALSLVMYWGADAYPFTKGCLGQLNLKSSLEILFHSTGIKELNNKVIFLYAEPPGENLKMKCTLEKLVQMHGEVKFEIVYVGRFSVGSGVGEGFQKAYEDAIESMNWAKLSFEDMMTFWHGCKYLSDEEVQEANSASTLSRIVKAVVNEERRLVVLDGDGMVTAHGIDVVEMACESSNEKDDDVDFRMKEKLRQSFGEGKCGEVLRRYFRDELNHPQHHHPLRPQWTACRFSCNRCGCEGLVYTPYGKRTYRCDECDWDLCWDCWKMFVNEEVRGQEALQS